MPGGQRRLHAVLGQHAPSRNADRQNRRLGVFSELELILRPIKDQPREREAESLVGLGKGLGGNRKALGEFAAHAYGLRTLPRKEKG